MYMYICMYVYTRLGVHEWSITLTKRCCCGYAGIAISDDTCNTGASQHLADYNQSMGFSNFSGSRNVSNSVGSVARFRLDIDQGMYI